MQHSPTPVAPRPTRQNSPRERTADTTNLRSELAAKLNSKATESAKQIDLNVALQQSSSGQSISPSILRRKAPDMFGSSRSSAASNSCRSIASSGSSMSDVDEEVRLSIAALYVQDAFAGRLDHGLATTWVQSSRAHALFRFKTHPAFQTLLLLALLMLYALPLFEPAASMRWPQPHWSAGAVVGSVLCLLPVIVDIVLTAYLFGGLGPSLRKKWHRIYFVLAALQLLDLLVLAAGGGRPFRCLRSFLLLARIQTLRRVCSGVIRSWRVIASSAAFLALLVLVLAAIGVHLFAGVYTLASVANTSSPAFDVSGIHQDDFTNLGYAFFTIFQVLTTENYPTVAEHAVDLSRPAAAGFFIVCWYLLHFVVLAMVTAIIVETYWSLAKRRIRKESVKERRALIRAFTLIDSKGTGSIGLSKWIDFMGHLMPASSLTEKRVRFAILDFDGNGKITAFNFLQIGVLQELKMQAVTSVKARRRGSITNRRASFSMWTAKTASKPWASRVGKRVAWLRKKAHWLDFAATIAQLGLVLFTSPGRGDEAAAACAASFALFWVSVLACLFRLQGMIGRPNAWSILMTNWSTVADLVILVACFILYVILYAASNAGAAWGMHASSGYSPFDFAFVCELALASRMLWGIPVLHRLFPLVIHVVPIFGSLSVIFFAILAFFATLGMELFADQQIVTAELIPHAILYEGHATFFGSYHLALLSVLQVLITNDWHTLEYATGTALGADGVACSSGARRVASAVYFGLMYTTLQIVLFPVLIALATNSYMLFAASLRESEALHEQPTRRRESSSGRDKARHLRRSMVRSYRDILKLGRGGTEKKSAVAAAVAAASAKPEVYGGLPKNPTSPSSVPASADLTEESTFNSHKDVFYVHMRKSKNYMAGGWRRDLMRSELGDVDMADVSDLTENGRRDAEEVLRLWRQTSQADVTAPSTAPSAQNWQRAMRHSLAAGRGTSAEVFTAASDVPQRKAVVFARSLSDVDEDSTTEKKEMTEQEEITSSRSVPIDHASRRALMLSHDSRSMVDVTPSPRRLLDEVSRRALMQSLKLESRSLVDLNSTLRSGRIANGTFLVVPDA